MRVFANRVLRRISGPRRDEIIRAWRISHIEEPHNLYSSSNIIRMIKSRRIRLVGHVARIGEKNTFRVLVGKPEGKRTLGRPRHGWEDNSKTDLRVILVGWCGMDWINLSQDRDQ
jgi:hypothetical protein